MSLISKDISRPTQANISPQLKRWLLLERKFLLAFAFVAAIAVVFLPEASVWRTLLFVLSGLVFTENVIAYKWRTRWWSAQYFNYYFTPWEKRTEKLISAGLKVWALIGIVSLSFHINDFYFLVTTLVYGFIVAHGEILKKVHELSRNLMILMPISQDEFKEFDPAQINKIVTSESDIVNAILAARLSGKCVRSTAGKNSSRTYREPVVSEQGFIQLDLSRYKKLVSIDIENKRVTVQAGMPQGDLADILQKNSWALRTLNGSHNLTIGGTVATGSFCAARFPLNSSILAMTVIEADGSIVEIDRYKNADILGPICVR